MKIQEHIANGWLFCVNEHAAKQSSGKLHAALPVKHFDDYHQKVYQVLMRAVEDGVIPAFKILNCGNSQALSEQLDGQEIFIDENPRARLYNNPFTIYLYENSNRFQLADLCQQLEFILKSVPVLNKKHLSIADLPLTEHLSYRQENIEGQYIAIATAEKSQLEILKQIGENSKEYAELKQLTAMPNVGLDDKAKQRENEILGFYNNNYKYYKKELKSPDLQRQFQAACQFLQIDKEFLLKQKTEEAWKSEIARGYRLLALKFHPDKVSSEVQDQSKKLFNLVTIAQAILEEIAKTPKILDKAELLKQEAYIPVYQYELEKFNEDPYYYIRLAQESSYVFLYKNWDYNTVETIIKSGVDEKQDIILYKPQVRVYTEKEREKIKETGEKAFYLLFMAGALPRRFGQWHLNSALESAQDWLLEKALTTAEFIASIDSYNLISLAIKATKAGVVNIGRTVEEIFQYYYLQFPETLYAKRLDKMVEKGLDLPSVCKFILDNPDNLAQLNGSLLETLIKNNNILKESILKDRNLAQKLSSYYIEQEILAPFFAEKGIDGLEINVLKQLYFGEPTLLPFLSVKKLKHIADLIDSNTKILPAWLKEELDFELDVRRGRKELVHKRSSVKPSSFYYTDVVVTDAALYLKKELLSSEDIVLSLNKDTLIWLAAEPEIDWSHYLAISKGLLALNEVESARRYLARLAMELSINIAGMLIPEVYEAIQARKEILANQGGQAKAQKIKALLEDYENLVYKNNLEDSVAEKQAKIEEIKKQIKVLGEEKKLHDLDKSYYKTLRAQFFNWVDKLKAEGYSEETKQAILEIKKKVLSSGYRWSDFSDRAGDLYALMYSLIGIEDSNHDFIYEEQKFAKQSAFGLSIQGELFEGFEKLFQIYQCLGKEDDFYRHLSIHTNIKQGNMFSGGVVFDKKQISDNLSAFLNNEFTVYIDGRRENNGYKTTRYFDHQNIKDFSQLYTLFERLGKKDDFEACLLDAYQRLYSDEIAFRETYDNYRQTTDHSPRRPLAKYMAIRGKSEQIHSTLENMAIDFELYRIITDIYKAISGGGGQKLYRAIVTSGMEEKNSKSLLQALQNYLVSCAVNSMEYQKLLQEFKESPILRFYLRDFAAGAVITPRALGMSLNPLITAQNNEEISYLIGSSGISPASSPPSDIIFSRKAMIAAVDSARGKYADWYAKKQEYRGARGFFSFIRHGKEGQENARRFFEKIELDQNEESVLKSINNYLLADETKYHRHSFSAFLLDELRKITVSPWAQISFRADSNLYDKNVVREILQEESSADNEKSYNPN